MIENPTFHRGPFDDPASFYDRGQAVDQVSEMVSKGQSVSVTGSHKIGKTWFLRYISHPTILHEHGLDPRRNICAYIDCQHPSIQQKEAQVYQGLLKRIISAARRVGVDLELKPCDGCEAGTAFDQALKDMHRRGLRIILLLDRFEGLAQNPNLDAIFFNHLRALTQADDVDLIYVTASRIPPVELYLERGALPSSSFFNIFQPVQLCLFSEQDSRHLVEDSLRKAGKRLPKDLLVLIQEMGGGHPFFLQMAGQHACELAITGEALTEDQRQAFLKRVTKDATNHFKSYWQELDHHGRYALATLPSLRPARRYREIIERLSNDCLIVQRNDRYDYFSPLFEAFVRRQKANQERIK